MPSKVGRRIAETVLAAVLVFGTAAPCAATTAGEVFRANETEIATNRFVEVGGYLFGIGRAISKNGGDAVGFSKARLLAQRKILDASGLDALEISGMETVLEKCESPEHYMVVVAVPKDKVQPKRRPPQHKKPKPEKGEDIEEYEPRGYWEESGVKANETWSETQFL